MTLVCFIALWYRRPWACAAAYFGVLTASIQGLITPMLYEGFPSAAFFAFFIGTAFCLFPPCICRWCWNGAPAVGRRENHAPVRRLPSPDYSRQYLAGNELRIYPVRPEGSVLEYFGPAPWYLLTLQIPALVVLRLLYLTVRPRKKKREEETASVEKLPGQ